MGETESLRALMEADRWIERVGARRAHLAEAGELAALEVELRALLTQLREAEARLAPMKGAYEEVARESSRLRDRARSLDTTLSSSTASARELTALQGELANVRTRLAECEDRELELLVDAEPLQDEVDAVKRKAQPGVARRAELIDVVAQLQASLEDELIALRLARGEKTTDVAPALLNRYETAMAHAGTSGAAQVVEGHCDGCRIALSPLDLDRFRNLAADTFMVCPECGRLLLA